MTCMPSLGHPSNAYHIVTELFQNLRVIASMSRRRSSVIANLFEILLSLGYSLLHAQWQSRSLKAIPDLLFMQEQDILQLEAEFCGLNINSVCMR